MANASLQAVMAACLSGYAEHHPLSPRQWQVCHHLLDCRTAALGGFALECDPCGDCLRIPAKVATRSEGK